MDGPPSTRASMDVSLRSVAGRRRERTHLCRMHPMNRERGRGLDSDHVLAISRDLVCPIERRRWLTQDFTLERVTRAVVAIRQRTPTGLQRARPSSIASGSSRSTERRAIRLGYEASLLASASRLFRPGLTRSFSNRETHKLAWTAPVPSATAVDRSGREVSSSSVGGHGGRPQPRGPWLRTDLGGPNAAHE